MSTPIPFVNRHAFAQLPEQANITVTYAVTAGERFGTSTVTTSPAASNISV